MLCGLLSWCSVSQPEDAVCPQAKFNKATLSVLQHLLRLAALIKKPFMLRLHSLHKAPLRVKRLDQKLDHTSDVR